MSHKFTINVKLQESPTRRTLENTEQEMLDQANAFFQAGSRCEADFMLTPNITNSLTAPAAVCYAFATEIYLKLLNHIAQVSFKRNHKLIELFNGLPENVIEIITKHYGTTEPELRETIEAVSNAFAEWRYLYEINQTQTSTTVLFHICRSLHNAIKELHPQLGITFENRLAI